MSVYKRGDGRWQVRIDVDRGADGKRRRRALGTFRTRKEAERAERDALAARDLGIDLVPDRVTVGELLTRYLANRAGCCAAKTNERYTQLVEQYIAPHIGSIALGKLRPAHVAGWQTALQQSGGAKGRALSPKSVFHARAVLVGALRWAVKMELVGRNVCEAVQAPKVPRSTAKALTIEEVGRILAVANDTRWSAFVTLAFATGARRGELCALRWDDVDLETRTLTIRASLSQTRAGVALKPTKTDRVRTIPLSRLAGDALRRQRALQAHERLRAGGAYAEAGWAFADELGRCVPPMRATDAFRELAKKAGISSSARLHDARHTAATTLLVSGVDVRTVASIMGHATATMTLATYAHVLADAQRDAVDRLGSALERRGDGSRSPRETPLP